MLSDLSISEATGEIKTLTGNLAHRESTHQFDPDSSFLI